MWNDRCQKMNRKTIKKIKRNKKAIVHSELPFTTSYHAP